MEEKAVYQKREPRGKMAESSPFAQRLQAITERRRLQDRILTTRRELEEERLRAERLKRKSLRYLWLMEGTSTSTDANDHTSSFLETETRIQKLEQDLASLESQMQQLDNPELRQGQRQLEEPVKAETEEKPLLDGIGKADGTSPSSPEGPFGNQSIPDNVDIKMTSVVTGAGKLPSHQGNAEAAPAPMPASQNLNSSEAPENRQRKLAVEEMVIRDHLGQEVGSMDAVGQKQVSIGKEEELEDHADLENGLGEQDKPTPCILGHEKALEASETQVVSELGNRDGPEGQSPPAQDQQSPPEALQPENSYSLKHQEDVERDILAKGTTMMEEEERKLPEQIAKVLEPAEDLATGNAPATEPVGWEEKEQLRKEGLQESCESEMTVELPGGERGESGLDQSTLLLTGVIPVQEMKVPSSLEEAKIPLLDSILSSSLPDQILQDQIPTLQDVKGSLLDENLSSFQKTEGSLLDPVLSLLPTQNSSTLLNQTPPLQENKKVLLLEESLLDSNPASLQNHLSSAPEQKPPSLQDGTISPQEIKHSLSNQVPSSLNEANGQPLDQIPTTLQDQSPSLPNQIPSPLPDQFVPLQEVDSALPEQVLSSLPETETSFPITTALQDQELSVQETKEPLPDITSTSVDQQCSLADKITPLQEAKNSSLVEIPLTLQEDQKTTPSDAQVFSLPEADTFLPGKIPSSVAETKHIFPDVTPASVPDQIPPVMQDQKPILLEDQASSSLQEVGESLPEQIQQCLPSLTSPSLPGASGTSPGQDQPTLSEDMPVSLPGQTPCLQEGEKTLPEEQILSSLPEEMPSQSDKVLSHNQLQCSTMQESANFPDVLPLSTQEPAQATPENTSAGENLNLKKDEDASLAIAASAEATEVLENLHAEQQPLLEECKALVASPDTSTGKLQSKVGDLKPLVATRQETPTYTTTSANTASSRQLQPAVPYQGEDQVQGQSRRKQKSCQCCTVM